MSALNTHPSVPVLSDDREIGVCDFCFVDVAGCWTYWTKPFTVRLQTGTQYMDMNQDELWGACQNCHDLIERGDYARLLRQSFKAQITPPDSIEVRASLWASLRQLFEIFEANRIGDPVWEPPPVNSGFPPG